MKLGAHVPILGGIDKAADNAHLIGCEVMQIFTSNPKGWNFSIRYEEEIESFKSKIKKYKIESVYGHSIYLTNLASPNPYIYTNSINSLISGLVLARKAGFSGVVTHIGSYTGSDYETGLRNVTNALEQALKATEGKVPILLETDAGSGNRMGRKFAEIGDITKVLQSDKVRVCLDTCHIFASGYDIRTTKGLEKTLDNFEKEIGLSKLALIHLNDSKGELGTNIDRHEIIGEGNIGLKAFGNIINHNKLEDIPGVVETPDNKTLADENISLKRLKGLRK